MSQEFDLQRRQRVARLEERATSEAKKLDENSRCFNQIN